MERTTLAGAKEVLGLWIEQNEGAKFWLKVVNELSDRRDWQQQLRGAQGQRVAADVANYATGGAVIIHYPVRDGTG